MSDAQKYPFLKALSGAMHNVANDNDMLRGRALPCHVVAVSGQIVTVQFDMLPGAVAYPQITIPIATFAYIRYPVQPGDKGVTVPADVSLRGQTALGTGIANLSLVPSLTALYFLPLANDNWSKEDPNKIVLYGPDGAILKIVDNSASITISPEKIVASANDEIDVSGTNLVSVSSTEVDVAGSQLVKIDSEEVDISGSDTVKISGSEISASGVKSVTLSAPNIILNGIIHLNGQIVQDAGEAGDMTASLIGPLIVQKDAIANMVSVSGHGHDVPGIQTGDDSVVTLIPNPSSTEEINENLGTSNGSKRGSAVAGSRIGRLWRFFLRLVNHSGSDT
jgi:phage baseplate assembly protein gpV